MEDTSKAKELLKAKKYTEALFLYKEELRVSAINIPALAGAVDALQNLENFDEAITLCKKTINEAPNLTIPHVLLAYLYHSKGDLENSIREAKRALDIEPASTEVLCCYGTILLYRGMYQDAIPFLRDAINKEPDFYMAHNNLAACYQMLGDGDNLHNEIKIIFQLRPTFENTVRITGSYVEKNKTLVALILLLPILALINQKFKLLPLLYIPLVLQYIASGAISLKNKKWQDAKIKFLRATFYFSIILFVWFLASNFTLQK